MCGRNGGHEVLTFVVCQYSENEKKSTALMLAALEGDEIIVDILIACVRETMIIRT